MPDNTPEVSVEPTQADRDIAAQSYLEWVPFSTEKYADEMRRGLHDKGVTVQRFARHRLASQTPPATQPSATVDRLLRAVDKARGWYGPCNDPEMAKALAELDAVLATLHTPPPVATATVVDAGWRPEVIAFANLMERQLRANDHKPGWKDDEPFDLQERVEQELAELSTAIAEWEGHTGYTEAALTRAVGRKAADVANMAMMVADVCGALATPTPTAGERR